jgi:hypothetical protein
MKILIPSAVGMLGFVAGVLFTLIIVGPPAGELQDALPPLAEVSTAPRDDRAPGRRVHSEEENEVGVPRFAPVEGSTLDQISEAGGSVVPRQMLRRVQINPFNQDGTVSAELAELFSLSEQEISELNSKLHDLRVRLDTLELANVSSVESEPNQTKISIQAFPQEGEALRHEFGQFVTSLLGDDGGEMIHHLLNGRSSDWGQFGEGPRTIRFGIEESPVADEILLVYEDGRERGGGGYTRRVSVPDFYPQIPIRSIAPEGEIFWSLLSEDLQKLFSVED